MKNYLLFLGVAVVLSGCATSSAPSDQPASPVRASAAASRDRLAELKPGMSADEVVGILGQPEKRRPVESVEVKGGEVWTYRKVVGVEERNVPIATKEVPYVDPFTGTTKMLQESVYTVETTQVIRTLNLMMLDGRLQQWAARHETKRSIL